MKSHSLSSECSDFALQILYLPTAKFNIFTQFMVVFATSADTSKAVEAIIHGTNEKLGRNEFFFSISQNSTNLTKISARIAHLYIKNELKRFQKTTLTITTNTRSSL